MLIPAWIVLAFLVPAQSPPSAEPDSASAALKAWRQGQQAMLEGHTDEAIVSFRKSLEQDPSLVCNRLSLAAAHLALGHEEEAAGELAQYLRAMPAHFAVRGQYAELLVRLERPDEARKQFERFAADVQGLGVPAEDQLVHCHSRLLELARKAEDEYGVHLHRGIGLYWLARQRAELPDPDGELSVEGLLCQSASELVQARRQKPDEARPCWYLYEVWSRLGRQQPARRWLRAAESAALFSYLTPTEHQNLSLALRRLAAEGSRK